MKEQTGRPDLSATEAANLAFTAAEPMRSDIASSPRAIFRYHRPRIGPRLQVGSLAGFEWNTVELFLPGLPAALNGLRMIHLTDLHLRPDWPTELGEVVDRINADPPEFVLFTGDFVDDKRDHRPALPQVQRLVASLRPKSGCFAVVGNHDGDLMPPHLVAMGVKVMTHTMARVPVRGHTVEIIGLPGPDKIDFDERFLHSLPPKRSDVPRIVLAHFPDLIRLMKPIAPDLYLAGHTHGGQMCLPNERALLTHDSLPKRMSKGAHDVDGTCLVVGRGFGFTTVKVRLFCPAEVIEIVLRPSDIG